MTRAFIDDTMNRYNNRHVCSDPGCQTSIDRVSRDLAHIVRTLVARGAPLEDTE